MDVNRFKYVRERLVALYKQMTEYTYSVIAPPESFLTFKELKKVSENPPIRGMDILGRNIERHMTITKMAVAIAIKGDDCRLAFSRPSQDLIEIYEGIQEYISLWLEVKRNLGWLSAASLEELETLEAVAKYIFSPYTEYKAREQVNAFGKTSTGEFTLNDALLGVWIYGSAGAEDISFISHIAIYKEEMGLTTRHVSSRSESLEDLLRGTSFGSGISTLF